MVKMFNFLFYAQKVSYSFKGLAALEPLQNGGQRGPKIDFFLFFLENDLYTKGYYKSQNFRS